MCSVCVSYGSGWITVYFPVLKAKKKCPSLGVCVCVCVYVRTRGTPVSTNVHSNMVCHGPEGKHGSSHMCHGVHTQLPIYVFISISVNSCDLILTLGENIS